MEKFHREESRKIWLVGDSPPKYANRLRYPLDSHHSAVHCIWTSVSSKINHCLFKHSLELSDDYPHIRNAVTDKSHWENGDKICDYLNKCKLEQEHEYNHIKDLDEHKPKVVITFGYKPFLFFNYLIKEISSENDNPLSLEAPNSGTESKLLGDEFKKAINKFSLEEINLLPLLHISVGRGKKFLEGQADYCDYDRKKYEKDNYCYFSHVGEKIAEVLLKHRDYFKSESILRPPDYDDTNKSSERRII